MHTVKPSEFLFVFYLAMGRGGGSNSFSPWWDPSESATLIEVHSSLTKLKSCIVTF